MVNVAGLLAFQVLTTNVTGHAALLAEHLSLGHITASFTIIAWLLLFLAGAFFSGICTRLAGANSRHSYTIPIIVEFVLLISVGLLAAGAKIPAKNAGYFAGALLFAMGVQNALVSAISGSVVRTTHLTGIFTDLGIDLAEWATVKAANVSRLKKRIILRIVIITSFILGGIISGFLFMKLHFRTFYISAGILTFTLFYDAFRINLQWWLRRRVKPLKRTASTK